MIGVLASIGPPLLALIDVASKNLSTRTAHMFSLVDIHGFVAALH
jgi:hypothetical protein